MFSNNNCYEPSSKLRIALLGCGRIAERHAEILGGFKIEDAILVAVCDLDFAKAKYLGEKYSVPYFTNFHEMLIKVSIDVVSILTESGNHAKDVFALAPYGKHLIVEKPMALSIGDAEK